MGFEMMGTGIAEGQDRAGEAARRAISRRFLGGASVTGARDVIMNATGGPCLSRFEVSEAPSVLQKAADEDVTIMCGTVVDATLKDKLKLTVIATGLSPPMSIKLSVYFLIDTTPTEIYPLSLHDALPI